jgi:hypothetical protein
MLIDKLVSTTPIRTVLSVCPTRDVPSGPNLRNIHGHFLGKEVLKLCSISFWNPSFTSYFCANFLTCLQIYSLHNSSLDWELSGLKYAARLLNS